MMNMSIQQEMSVEIPQTTQSPEKKTKFKSAVKKVLATQQFSHFVTARAAKQLPLKGLSAEGQFDSDKLMASFNRTVDLINEYIGLTLKNKNSLNPP